MKGPVNKFTLHFNFLWWKHCTLKTSFLTLERPLNLFWIDSLLHFETSSISHNLAIISKGSGLLTVDRMMSICKVLIAWNITRELRVAGSVLLIRSFRFYRTLQIHLHHLIVFTAILHWKWVHIIYQYLTVVPLFQRSYYVSWRFIFSPNKASSQE